MKFDKIQLINASVSAFYKSFSRNGCYPPLGLVALASFIKNNKPEVEVEIIDNDLLSMDKVFKKIDSPLVGINSNVLSYSNTIEIAKYAKQNGSFVLIGGNYASTLAVEILKNRQFVDFIAVGDGEDILLRLIKGAELSMIPGLAYRKKNGEIVLNPSQMVNSYSPILDFSTISSLEVYFEKYEDRMKKYIGYSKSLQMYSHKGCPRKNNGGCLFCWQQPQFSVLKTPKQFWREISFYYDKYGVKLFWDVSNNFTWDKEWLRNIVNSKPKELDVYFYIFAHLHDIDQEVVELLENLKCAEAFIGFESNDNECLTRINKGTSEEINLHAIDLFKGSDIFIYPSFVLGLPGESKESIEKTIRFAYQLKESLKIYEITCSILTPLPGSPAWNLLQRNTSRPGLYLGKDLFDWTKVKKDWVENFCHVNYQYLCSAADKILSLVDIDNRIEFINNSFLNKTGILDARRRRETNPNYKEHRKKTGRVFK